MALAHIGRSFENCQLFAMPLVALPYCLVADLEGRPFVDDAAVALLARATLAPLILLRRSAL